MQIILFLIIVSLFVAGGFLIAFFWAVRDGQYDDDITPSMRLLIDDDMHQQDEESDDKTLQNKTINTEVPWVN